MVRKSTIQLSLLASASLFIYISVLVLPYNLLQWWSHPHLNIAEMRDYSPLAGASFVMAILLLFLLYWLATQIVLRFRDARAWVLVIGAALLFNGAMLLLYPVDSSDVFDNIMRGRMTTLYGGNPFYQRPSSQAIVRSDPFYRYSGWNDYPTAYGPGWELIAAAVARLAGDDVITNVVAFKLASLAFEAGTLAVVALLLRQYAPQRALYGVTLLAWNPLAVYSVPGNAHNDIVMTFFIVLGIYFLARRHYTLAAMAETAGALVKFIPALLLPIVLIAGLAQADSWRKRLYYLVVTGFACMVMMVALYAPFWRGGDILGADWRSHLFTTSLPTLVKMSLQPHLGAQLTDAFVSRAALLVMAVWVVAQALALWRARRMRIEWTRYAGAALSIVLFYLLVTCLWFQPWYAVWPVALAALLPDSMIARGAIVLSLAAAFKMPIFDFVMGVRPGNVPPISGRELEITLGTLGVPWLYFLYQQFKLDELPRPERGIANTE
jgi:alpha-1,6-mannosyltransferase